MIPGFYWARCLIDNSQEVVQVNDDGTFWRFGHYATYPLDECELIVKIDSPKEN